MTNKGKWNPIQHTSYFLQYAGYLSIVKWLVNPCEPLTDSTSWCSTNDHHTFWYFVNIHFESKVIILNWRSRVLGIRVNFCWVVIVAMGNHHQSYYSNRAKWSWHQSSLKYMNVRYVRMCTCAWLVWSRCGMRLASNCEHLTSLYNTHIIH